MEKLASYCSDALHRRWWGDAYCRLATRATNAYHSTVQIQPAQWSLHLFCFSIDHIERDETTPRTCQVAEPCVCLSSKLRPSLIQTLCTSASRMVFDKVALLREARVMGAQGTTTCQFGCSCANGVGLNSSVLLRPPIFTAL